MKAEKPLVSVIIPLYDTEAYVGECIKSALGQTYGTLEIICVNDGSTDATRELAAQAIALDGRARIYDQENQGLSGARNAALDLATGSYVLFLDSDDMLAPNAVEALVDAAERLKADIVASKCEEDAELKGLIAAGKPLEGVQFERASLDDFYYQSKMTNHACGKLFSRLLFEGPASRFEGPASLRFPLGRPYEDVATTYLLMERAGSIAYTGSGLYYYRQNDEGIARTYTVKNALGLWQAYEEIREHFTAATPASGLEGELTKPQRFYLLTVLHTLLRLLNKAPRGDEADRLRAKAEKEFDALFSFGALDFRQSPWFSSKLLVRRLRIGKSLLMRLAK